MSMKIDNPAAAAIKAAETAAADTSQVGGNLASEAHQIDEGLIRQFAGGSGGAGAPGVSGDAFSVLNKAGSDLLGLGDDLGFAGAQQTSASAATTDPASSGGSLFDKLFALMDKLQGQLNQQVDAASQLDPSDQAGLQKAMFQVQQTQNLMQQIVTTATNLLKTQSDTAMSEARNFSS